MSADHVYKDGDIVWIKLRNNYWWPGEVTDGLREQFKHFKRKPYCVVKFFNEDTFEYVNSAKRILPFQSEKKDEFIEQGLALHQAKHKFMEKFPADVKFAERLTQTTLVNNRPGSIIKVILTQPLMPTFEPTTNKNTNKLNKNKFISARKDSLPTHVSTIKILDISSKRGNDQTFPLAKESPVATSNVRNVNLNDSNIYRCGMCDFTSIRQNVIVLHRKSHGNRTPANAILSAEPGLNDVSTSDATSICNKPSTTALTASAEISARASEEDESVNIEPRLNGTTDTDIIITQAPPKQKQRLTKNATATAASRSLRSSYGTQDAADVTTTTPGTVDAVSTTRTAKNRDIQKLRSSGRSLRSSTPNDIHSLATSNNEQILTESNAESVPPTATVVDEVEKDWLDDSMKDVSPVKAAIPKLQKHTRSLEILRQMIADDWTDDDNENHDDADNDNVNPIAVDLEAVNCPNNAGSEQSSAAVNNSELAANSSKAPTTTETTKTTKSTKTESRVRNIPKKDRRDAVIKDFSSSTANTQPIITCISKITPPLIVIPDSSVSSISSDTSYDSVVLIESSNVSVGPTAAPPQKPEVGTEAITLSNETPASNATMSCFDFEDEEENESDLLTSIANFKKKYFSPEKSSSTTQSPLLHQHQQQSDNSNNGYLDKTDNNQHDCDKLEQSDRQLADEIEQLLQQTSASTTTVTATATATVVESKNDNGKDVPLKERGRRIFKSRNRSHNDEQANSDCPTTTTKSPTMLPSKGTNKISKEQRSSIVDNKKQDMKEVINLEETMTKRSKLVAKPVKAEQKAHIEIASTTTTIVETNSKAREEIQVDSTIDLSTNQIPDQMTQTDVVESTNELCVSTVDNNNDKEKDKELIELSERLTPPTDETSSEAGAEFGSPASMLDEDRMPTPPAQYLNNLNDLKKPTTNSADHPALKEAHDNASELPDNNPMSEKLEDEQDHEMSTNISEFSHENAQKGNKLNKKSKKMKLKKKSKLKSKLKLKTKQNLLQNVITLQVNDQNNDNSAFVAAISVHKYAKPFEAKLEEEKSIIRQLSKDTPSGDITAKEDSSINAPISLKLTTEPTAKKEDEHQQNNEDTLQQSTAVSSNENVLVTNANNVAHTEYLQLSHKKTLTAKTTTTSSLSNVVVKDSNKNAANKAQLKEEQDDGEIAPKLKERKINDNYLDTTSSTQLNLEPKLIDNNMPEQNHKDLHENNKTQKCSDDSEEAASGASRKRRSHIKITPRRQQHQQQQQEIDGTLAKSDVKDHPPTTGAHKDNGKTHKSETHKQETQKKLKSKLQEKLIKEPIIATNAAEKAKEPERELEKITAEPPVSAEKLNQKKPKIASPILWHKPFITTTTTPEREAITVQPAIETASLNVTSAENKTAKIREAPIISVQEEHLPLILNEQEMYQENAECKDKAELKGIIEAEDVTQLKEIEETKGIQEINNDKKDSTIQVTQQHQNLNKSVEIIEETRKLKNDESIEEENREKLIETTQQNFEKITEVMEQKKSKKDSERFQIKSKKIDIQKQQEKDLEKIKEQKAEVNQENEEENSTGKIPENSADKMDERTNESANGKEKDVKHERSDEKASEILQENANNKLNLKPQAKVGVEETKAESESESEEPLESQVNEEKQEKCDKYHEHLPNNIAMIPKTVQAKSLEKQQHQQRTKMNVEPVESNIQEIIDEEDQTEDQERKQENPQPNSTPTKTNESNDLLSTESSSIGAVPEKVRINVDLSNPLSSQIENILGANKSPLKTRKTTEDDAACVTTTNKVESMKTATTAINIDATDAIVTQIQNLCPQMKVTRKERLIEPPDVAINTEQMAKTFLPSSDQSVQRSNCTAPLCQPRQQPNDKPIILQQQIIQTPLHTQVLPQHQQNTPKYTNTNSQIHNNNSTSASLLTSHLATPASSSLSGLSLKTVTKRPHDRLQSDEDEPRKQQQKYELTDYQKQLQLQQRKLHQQQQLQQQRLKNSNPQSQLQPPSPTTTKQLGTDSRGNKYVIITNQPTEVPATLTNNATNIPMKAPTASETNAEQASTVTSSTEVTSQSRSLSPKLKSSAATATGGRKQALTHTGELKQMHRKYSEGLLHRTLSALSPSSSTSTSTSPSPSLTPSPLQSPAAAAAPAPAPAPLPSQSSLSLASPLGQRRENRQKHADRLSHDNANRRLSAPTTTTSGTTTISSSSYDSTSPLPAKIPKTSHVPSGILTDDDVNLAQKQFYQLQQQKQQQRLQQQKLQGTASSPSSSSASSSQSPPPLHHLHNRKPRKQPQQHRTGLHKNPTTPTASPTTTLSPSTTKTINNNGTDVDTLMQDEQQHQQQQDTLLQTVPAAASPTTSNTPNNLNEQLMQIQNEEVDDSPKILAVPTQPIPGYNDTFLLCTLVNNNYKPIDNTPLYLDHESNQLVPVPLEALDGQPSLIVNHPSGEDVPNNSDTNGNEATPASSTTSPTQTQQQNEQQEAVSKNLHANKSDEGSATRARATAAGATPTTQLICLQPMIDVDAEDDITDGSMHNTALQEGLIEEDPIDVDIDEDDPSKAGFMTQEESGDIVTDNAVILNIEGQQIILDAATFAHLLASPDTNTQLITEDGTEFVLTREVLLALQAQQQEAQQQSAGHNIDPIDPQQLELQQQEQLQEISTEAGTPTDILAVAIDGTELYPAGVLQIETSTQGFQQLLASDGSSMVFPVPAVISAANVTPPLTAHTSATSALLNQTPIMSTLEKPSTTTASKHKAIEVVASVASDALLQAVTTTDMTSTRRANLDESLAVIGVTAQTSTVPTSLELPITVTNPNIAPPKVTMSTQLPTQLVHYQPSGLVVASTSATAVGATHLYSDEAES